MKTRYRATWAALAAPFVLSGCATVADSIADIGTNHQEQSPVWWNAPPGAAMPLAGLTRADRETRCSVTPQPDACDFDSVHLEPEYLATIHALETCGVPEDQQGKLRYTLYSTGYRVTVRPAGPYAADVSVRDNYDTIWNGDKKEQRARDRAVADCMLAAGFTPKR